jgi:hypothetical protein
MRGLFVDLLYRHKKRQSDMGLPLLYLMDSVSYFSMNLEVANKFNLSSYTFTM